MKQSIKDMDPRYRLTSSKLMRLKSLSFSSRFVLFLTFASRFKDFRINLYWLVSEKASFNFKGTDLWLKGKSDILKLKKGIDCPTKLPLLQVFESPLLEYCGI